MKTSINDLETKLEKKIDESSQKSEASCKTTGDKLDKIETNISRLSDQIVTLEQELEIKEKVILSLQMKVETLEEKGRSHNVIIEGLPEPNHENLRRILDELFEFLELSYDSEWADTVFRIGVKNDKTK